MKSIQLLLICMISTTLLAQEKEIKAKYGKISEEDVKMKYYSKDSSAEAVLLYEEADISFSYDDLSGIKMIMNYFGRYKILKKSGLDRGIIKIPLYQGTFDQRELLSNVDGCTYNWENGKIVSSKLTKASIFHEHVVDDRYQDKLSLPNLMEGSVFEYRYTKETPFSVQYVPDAWFFQGSIPVQWSELTVKMPKNFTYRILPAEQVNFAINTQGNIGMKLGDLETSATIYRMAVKHVPAFHEQMFMTSTRDYKMRVEFELTSVTIPNRPIMNFSEGWGNLAGTLLKSGHYSETLKRQAFLAPTIESIKEIKDTMQRIQKAFDYVSKTLEWNEIASVFAQTDASKVFENKKGSATEINLILVSLLRAVGLKANPVIISTKSNGKINERYPSLHQFNYTIVSVDYKGEDLLMDATDRYTKPGMLPERCLNFKGRLINEDRSRFVSLDPKISRGKMEMVTASMDPKTGEIKGKIVASNTGYKAHEMKVAMKENGEEHVAKEIKKKNAEWKIENFKIENNEGAEDVNMTFDFRLPEDISAEIIYLNPLMTGKLASNPFTEQNRVYPVDLGTPSDEVTIATIKIPEGYQIDEYPKAANVELPDNMGKFTYTISTIGDAIKITSRITMKEYRFSANEYEMLREFYDHIVQKHAEQLVIAKIKK